MHLIDTKVISELHKGGRANPGVTAFVAGLAPDDIYLSVQTIGEIRRGLESIRHRGDHEQADRLEVWLEALLADYSDRILGFDLDCAQVWGRLMSPNPQHAIDKQIAAIALIHDLTVVTRNTSDFGWKGVGWINPLVSLCRGVGLQDADTRRDPAARALGANRGREALSMGNIGVWPLILCKGLALDGPHRWTD